LQSYSKRGGGKSLTGGERKLMMVSSREEKKKKEKKNLQKTFPTRETGACPFFPREKWKKTGQQESFLDRRGKGTPRTEGEKKTISLIRGRGGRGEKKKKKRKMRKRYLINSSNKKRIRKGVNEEKEGMRFHTISCGGGEKKEASGKSLHKRRGAIG